jgi:hypothetical protein
VFGLPVGDLQQTPSVKSVDVTDLLSDLFILRRRGHIPARVRGQSGALVGQRRRCLYGVRQPLGVQLYRELQARLRDELLYVEIFYTLREAQIIIEMVTPL